jgi:hypothetical protein
MSGFQVVSGERREWSGVPPGARSRRRSSASKSLENWARLVCRAVCCIQLALVDVKP